MECMEARRALKSSLTTEMPLKTNYNYQQTISDDIWNVKGNDDFSIDEFFDLPNDNENIKNASFLQNEDDEEDKNSCHDDLVDDFFSASLHFSPDLAIPVDDMQELELWSHLMDDSVPEVTTAIPFPNPLIGFPLKKTGFNSLNRFEPALTRVPFIPSAVPVKPRSKRSRTPGNQTWFTGSVSRTGSPSSSSSSSSPTSTLVYPNPVHDMSMVFKKPGVKKPKKKPGSAVNDSNKENAGPTVQRRCSHCQVTKTPQWRLGPNGPKSLCNACGVRFKSGRLFPEYRPACSPTFSSEIHSNSHRKVLEMRRKKEMTGSSFNDFK